MTRFLTEGEVSVAKKVFKSSIDYPLVKIHKRKYVFLQADNSAMSPNGDIYVHGIFSHDYADESSALRGFFIHELVHVWQYQNKVLNVKLAAVWEILSNALKYNDAYRYTLERQKDLTDYKIEQQASIVEDFYRITYESILPRKARLNNSEQGPNLANLYHAVLKRFLEDPGYANGG